MRVRSFLAVQTLEGFEALGLDRDALLSEVGLDRSAVADRRGYIEWGKLASLLELGWTRLGADAARMRLVGRVVARAPSHALLRRLARTVVSANRVYEIGTRWGAPADFPHLRLEHEPLSERLHRFRASIPEPHAPSLAFFHVFEGVLVEVPALLGLPRATIVKSEATPRTLEVVLELPRSPSIAARLRRVLRPGVRLDDAVDMLEEQRCAVADALAEARRAIAENRELLDRLPDFVIIHRDGVILWMNRANVRALGYERSEEVVGRSLLDVVEPASRDVLRARMREPVGADVPEVSEVRLCARDGRVVILEVSPAQAVTFDGATARLVVGRDITERVRMQEKLLIADRMASIGMLAAGVAHEVNNPLAYVLNNIEMAVKGLAPLGEAASQSRAALGIALEGVDRIRTIVRDLLALSRVDDASIGPVDVVEVVQSTLALARKDISMRAVLAFDHEPVPPAAGTVARLGQVLLNLVTNALEAMRSSERRDNRLRVVVRPSSSGGALIEVTDNGVGILPEHAPRVFEPFFTTKPPGQGTGLGLPISQRLVAEMGGQLSFESTPGRGSTFLVTLPPWEVPAQPE